MRFIASQPKRAARPGQATLVHQQRRLSGAVAAKGARWYSQQERQEAVALAYQVGQKAASRQLGIPYSTVCHWFNKSRRDMRAALILARQFGLVSERDIRDHAWFDAMDRGGAVA